MNQCTSITIQQTGDLFRATIFHRYSPPLIINEIENVEFLKKFQINHYVESNGYMRSTIKPRFENEFITYRMNGNILVLSDYADKQTNKPPEYEQ